MGVRLTASTYALHLDRLPDGVPLPADPRRLPFAQTNRATGRVSVPRSPFVAAELVRLFGESLVMTREVTALVRSAEAVDELRAVAEAPSLPEPPGRTPWWDHQRRAFHLIRALFEAGFPGAALFAPLGSGKSKVAIGIADWLQAELILILGPLAAMAVWQREFVKHAARLYTVIPPDPSARVPERIRRIEYRRATTRLPVVVLMNYQAAGRPAFVQWAMDQPWDLLVCDEIHRIKDHAGVQSRAVARIARGVRYRLGITGTPLHHSPLDIWAQYRALDPGVFYQPWEAFRDRYQGLVLRRGEVHGPLGEEFRRKLYAIAYRPSRIHLQLPAVSDQVRSTRLGAQAQAIYDELERRLALQIEEGTVTASNALTHLLKLQEVACGWVRDDEGRTHEVGHEKAELLRDVLEDFPLDEPVVVVAVFREDMERIRALAEGLGFGVAELSGRYRELPRWESGHATLLIVEPRAGGESVDLSRAAYMVFYSLRFSLGEYQQVRARIHRVGQARPVTFLHLVVEGTVDARKLTYLQRRQEVIAPLLEDIRQRHLPLSPPSDYAHV